LVDWVFVSGGLLLLACMCLCIVFLGKGASHLAATQTQALLRLPKGGSGRFGNAIQSGIGRSIRNGCYAGRNSIAARPVFKQGTKHASSTISGSQR
jgi:hypothetical protein